MDAFLQRFSGAGAIARRNAGLSEYVSSERSSDFALRALLRARGAGGAVLQVFSFPL